MLELYRWSMQRSQYEGERSYIWVTNYSNIWLSAHLTTKSDCCRWLLFLNLHPWQYLIASTILNQVRLLQMAPLSPHLEEIITSGLILSQRELSSGERGVCMWREWRVWLLLFHNIVSLSLLPLIGAVNISNKCPSGCGSAIWKQAWYDQVTKLELYNTLQRYILFWNILCPIKFSLKFFVTSKIFWLAQSQGCTTCCSRAAELREKGERMKRKWRENEKWGGRQCTLATFLSI